MKQKLQTLMLSLLSIGFIHTSYAQEVNVKWTSAAVNGVGGSSPVLSKDFKSIYMATGATPDGEAKLYAIDLKGATKWNFDLTQDGTTNFSKNAGTFEIEASPIVGPDGTIYVTFGVGRYANQDGGSSAMLYAINPSGSSFPKWKFKPSIGSLIAQTPPVLLKDGNILIASRGTSGGVRLVNTEDGSQMAYNNTDPGWGTNGCMVALQDNNFYLQCQLKGIFGYKAEEGATSKITKVSNYNFAEKSAYSYGLAVDLESNVYGAGGDAGNAHIYSVKEGGKTVNWTYPATKNMAAKIHHGGIVINGNTIYATTDENNKLLAINKADGKLKWEYTAGANLRCTPVIDNNGNIHLGDRSGNYIILKDKGTTYSEIHKSQLSYGSDYAEEIYASPLIANDGTVYIVARINDKGDNKMYAITVDQVTGPAESEWPMKGGDYFRTSLQKTPGQVTSAEQTLSSNELNIYSGDGCIIIDAKDAEQVSIYNICGQLESQNILKAGINRIPFKSGIYFVKTSNQAVKVFIK